MRRFQRTSIGCVLVSVGLLVGCDQNPLAPRPFADAGGSIADASAPPGDAGLSGDAGFSSDAGTANGGSTDGGSAKPEDAGPQSQTRCNPLPNSGRNPLAQNPTAKEVFAFTTRGNGNRLTEGPIWDPSTQSLFFAEPLDNVIWNWRPGGTAQAVRRNSHFADGLDLTRDGKLVAAEGEQYGASYYALPGVVYERSVPIPAARRSRANDIVARYDGTLYITGTDSNTVYSVRAGATVATLEAEVPRPNGIALSPDETLLYVVSDTGNSSALYRFRLQADGAVNRSQMLPPFQIGAEPDGVTVDREGNLYIALRSANGQSVEVRAPNGSRWGVITLPNAAFNVAFGGPRWTTLYVTAFAEKPDPIGALFEIELPVEGCPQ